MFRIFLIILSLSLLPNIAAALNSKETQMRDFINSQQSAQISTLATLVNINSGTTNLPGVYKVGELLRPEFERLGFKTRWVEEPKQMHKAGTLIAERKGTQGKRLLLIGHLDTVFATDSKFKNFELRRHTAKGPGALDDKGGDVVLLYALKALHAVHALDHATITVVLTGDEESSGKPASISRKPLFDAARQSDVALDFEAAISLDTGTIARRGISNWFVTTYGNASHSATIFQKDVGAGAIFELARILNSMRMSFKDKYLTYNPGMLVGGTTVQYDDQNTQATVFGKTNIVARTAAARGDYRYLTTKEKQAFEKKLKVIVAQHLPYTKSVLTFEDGIPAMQPTAKNLALLKKYSTVSQDLQQGKITPLEPGLRGAGDISYISSIVPANLAGLGPMGIGSHTVIEAVELKSLPIQTQRAALLMYRLLQ